MELNTVLNPLDLYSILTRAYESYYEPEITNLTNLNKKIYEWEKDFRNSIQFEINDFQSSNDRFDEISIDLDSFTGFLNTGIIAMMYYNETIKGKKIHEYYEEVIFKCSHLLLEISNFESTQNLFLQMKLWDSFEFDY